MPETTALTTAPPKPPADPLPQIVDWILNGSSEGQIIEAIEATWPKRKARPLIVEAMKKISAAGTVDAESVRGFAIEASRLIYQRCMEAGDHPTALKALRQLVDLSK